MGHAAARRPARRVWTHRWPTSATSRGDRAGGMLVGGHFLADFVPAGLPWVHLDIAGPAWNGGGPHDYTPKGGTGAAVRTIIAAAEDLAGSVTGDGAPGPGDLERALPAHPQTAVGPGPHPFGVDGHPRADDRQRQFDERGRERSPIISWSRLSLVTMSNQASTTSIVAATAAMAPVAILRRSAQYARAASTAHIAASIADPGDVVVDGPGGGRAASWPGRRSTGRCRPRSRPRAGRASAAAAG